MISEDYNPLEYILKIQRLKLRIAIIPVLIVLVSFAINYSLRLDVVKYISLFGLLLYFFINLIFHYRRAVAPEEAGTVFWSPISGKIKEIDNEKHTITISKRFFDPADIRCPGNDFCDDFMILSHRAVLFENKCRLAGRLIGILPGPARCICILKENMKSEIRINARVTAGDTPIASVITDNDT
ncbi:MAG: hypothetical protein JXB60_04555 [Candidatus Cloacimonetes bacterium]|nr:hypothetical protein [Candidatus Cloacimonadota bacterium]